MLPTICTVDFVIARGIIGGLEWSCYPRRWRGHLFRLISKNGLVRSWFRLSHQDDKFPLPSKSALFQHLLNAKVFSKFDLKVGFWKLGIHPENRYKTAFCIPDHHYQWTVMPFGLKNAPSQFQKAMVTLFQLLLANALIYVDDILLFSKDADSHERLLTEFYKSKAPMTNSPPPQSLNIHWTASLRGIPERIEDLTTSNVIKFWI